MNKNPFIFGKPVESNRFYNREEEIETAIGFIKSLQNFSVVGERRIGKTSFLKYLLSRKTLTNYGIDPEQYIAVYCALDSLYEIRRDKLIMTIVEKIEEHIQIEVEFVDVFEKFRALIENLAINGKNLIIALDELEIIAPLLDDLSHWLRFIFQSGNVVVITASQTTVGKLSPDGAASPLFNIFGNLTLGLFSREQTETMIESMFRKGGRKLRKGEISHLADLSGGNPYLIQLIGFFYYKKKIDRDKFEGEILDQVNDVFEGYWRHLDEEEREFLLNVETSDNGQIGHNLEKKGFLFKEDGKWKIFSKIFGEFIAAKKRELKISQEEVRKERSAWILGIKSALAAIFLGFILYTIFGWGEIREFVGRITDNPSLFVDACSLIFTILSFIIIFVSFRKSQQESHHR